MGQHTGGSCFALYYGNSVIRFDEISPLWQKFTRLWQIFEGLFLIWQNIRPTLAHFVHHWAIFHCCKIWPNMQT